MNTIDRLRHESTLARYDFWLEMRGIRSSRRRELRRELRANLAEASADVGTTKALFGIGSPKELAYAATETDASRPRWSQGLLWGAGVFALLMGWLAITGLNIIQTLDAAGSTAAVDVHPFPWFGTTFTVQSSPGTLEASINPLWQLLVLPLLVFLLVAQPWRLLRRRAHSPALTSGERI
ncbi:MAG: hypothetical protein ABIP45_06465 [Knoellia sp.]